MAEESPQMLMVWTIACGTATAEIYENGTVDSRDPALGERLREQLTQPVDVANSGGGGRPLLLQPTDRRYVVARVRKMVADAADLEILEVRITGQ